MPRSTGRQTDDGLDYVVLDEELADQLFLATPAQHAVWHDRGHVPIRLEAPPDVDLEGAFSGDHVDLHPAADHAWVYGDPACVPRRTRPLGAVDGPSRRAGRAPS
jgi:hypothetical protein